MVYEWTAPAGPARVEPDMRAAAAALETPPDKLAAFSAAKQVVSFDGPLNTFRKRYFDVCSARTDKGVCSDLSSTAAIVSST